MKKKILFFTMVFALSICMIPKAFAKEVTVSNAEDLKQAIAEATEATTIKLETTIDLSNTDGDTLLIDNGKDITINLNGNDIVAEKNVIRLENSSLKLIGKGAVKETTPDFYGVVLIGSSEENETYLSVGEDVTIDAFYPVTVDVYKIDNGSGKKVSAGYSHNVKVDVY